MTCTESDEEPKNHVKAPITLIDHLLLIYYQYYIL